MATPHQVRGALLEEVALWLLEFAGYRTVAIAGRDPTLRAGHAGLEVRGRGTSHQIDAIADFTIGQPFTNPQRLLVEAKAYDQGRTIGIQDVRNAVGVLKDVGEFWTGAPSRRRYHYQYAIFSLTPFTKGAQRYAFAQDVYLVPLAASHYFAPIAAGLRAAVDGMAPRGDRQVDLPLHDLRRSLRQALRERLEVPDLAEESGWLAPLLASIRRVGSSLMGVAGRAFPLFLVPRQPHIIEGLAANISVRIRRQQGMWYLQPADGGEFLFSFDLPTELFTLYAERGVLSRERAVDMKAEHLSEIQALYASQGQARLLTFRLDQEWLRGVREQIARG